MDDHEGADSTAGPPASTDIAAALRSRDLLRRHKTDAAFSEFYRDHIRPLTAFLMRQGASTALAADLAQEAMAKAYRSWNEIHDPRAWIRTVASRDLLRSRMRNCIASQHTPAPAPCATLSPGPRALQR
ncbi:RNA polymerase sigma factor [Embleya sp. AB8]|uniref:RNA polymerase sigma factor n=1 Tax=Embleya sp. AB8 TaxID=3156304 RepID=UPI003C76AF04